MVNIKKIAVIEDDKEYANTLAAGLEDEHWDKHIIVDIISNPKAIANFNPTEYGLLIIDQNLFNGFNRNSQVIDDFSEGEMIAKKVIEEGYRGVVVLYTGDYKLVEKRNNPGFFSKLTGDIPIKGIHYLAKGNSAGQERLMHIVAEYVGQTCS